MAKNTVIPKFEDLIDQFHGGLSRVAASYEANPELQEELLQDILEAIWRSLKNFRAEASIKTYLYRIAHFRGARHVAQQVKHNKIHSKNDVDSIDYKHPEQHVEKQVQLETLLQAIHQLPIIQRQLITLFLEGFSYLEMAEVTGLDTNNIGVKLNRAKTSLKNMMESNDE